MEAGSKASRYGGAAVLLDHLTRFGEGISDLFLPRQCFGCGREMDEGVVCGFCTSTLEPRYTCRQLDGIDTVISCFAYEGVVRKLLKVLKFQGVQPLGTVLGMLVLQRCRRDLHELLGFDTVDHVVVVPLHWLKRFNRGFNQVQEIFRPLMDYYSWSSKSSVYRARYTPALYELPADTRKVVLERAFEFKPVFEMTGHVLILDDILTSGATLSSVAQCCREYASGDILSISALTLTDAAC